MGKCLLSPKRHRQRIKCACIWCIARREFSLEHDFPGDAVERHPLWASFSNELTAVAHVAKGSSTPLVPIEDRLLVRAALVRSTHANSGQD